ncbi:TPM domain-containing protein [Gilvibacter sediminis]|uniref:TPM domain-containing protein n=1 Tax=Gilvibacter sediminis TaxID=379071 RepID=UPI002350FE53|nr:TPM domain-containing protein [Gilvibacter sediminis]MDC7997482.1 TPM domain-containing protein [Gilvibacter sediminis]
MGQVESFLTADEEQSIIDAIHLAEERTSGEIRVHLEGHTDLSPMERAKEVFFNLKMDQTALANGVLIYVAVHDHNFTILGDRGINERVGQGFWDSTKDEIVKYFKEGHFAQGLIAGVTEAGKALAQYFPIQDNDTNELSNEISKGE